MEMKSEINLYRVFQSAFFRRDIIRLENTNRKKKKKNSKNNLLSNLYTSIYNVIINITYVESDESTFLETRNCAFHCFFKSSGSAY